MDISYNWLKSLLDIRLSAEVVAEKLTLVGHAVEEMQYLGEGIGDVLVARAVSIRQHPDADKLRLVTVDFGAGDTLEVVCGAPNVAEGGVYPFAPEGAVLPGGFTIKKAKIRGVESCGMLCSERELGLSDEASGLMELASGLKPGTRLVELLERDDWLMTMEITANRGDMWNHVGAARELQAYAESKMSLPEANPAEDRTKNINDITSVVIDDPDGCPRYMCRVIEGIEIKPSPRWLVNRIESLGQRSINNVVDVTNYVLFELGQPLHAFDLDRLDERRIVVRKAAPAEKILTLDGSERELGESMTVICDAKSPVAVAGVMGGELSAVSETTTRILLECAWFNPVSIRRTSRGLGLLSESSRRFERGIDPGMMEYALDRAAALMIETGGGKAATGVIDNYPRPHELRTVEMRPSRACKVIGIDLESESMVKILEDIDIRVKEVKDDLITVTVPSWRHDISQEIDLIEEVARFYGYDNVPVPEKLQITPQFQGREKFRGEFEIRRLMRGAGFNEAKTMSLSGSAMTGKIYGPDVFEPIRLQWPISTDDDILRPLIFSSLIPCIIRNVNRGVHDIRLFETGHVFPRKPGSDETGERTDLAIAATGAASPLFWREKQERFDFFSFKGIVEDVLDSLGASDIRFRQEKHPGLHPVISATVVVGGNDLGFIGQIDPKVAGGFEIPDDIFFCELDTNVLAQSVKQGKFRVASQFPGSRRDISILVDEKIECRALMDVIAGASRLVEDVQLFDLYQGEHVPAGKRSLAFSILFRSSEKTLVDEEVDNAFKDIVAKLEKNYEIKLR